MINWKPIAGFPNYVVSDSGIVAKAKNMKPLAQSRNVRNHTTYMRVTLFNAGIRYYRQVHRLVAEAFVPNPHNLPEIDHKDANGQNNTSSNLDWVTRSVNIRRAFERNPEHKLAICSQAGLVGGAVIRDRAEARYQAMLGNRFLKFIPAGILGKDAAIRYVCACGVQRTASVMWKELRNHKGKCPICTNTINRSATSLE